MAQEVSSNRRPIIILIAVLVAVMAASLAIVFLLPNQNLLTTSTQQPESEQTSTSQPNTFNLGVLQRTDYNALNVGLIESKQLPVQPFQGAGKANPFL